jgi:hypothetical protein
MSKLNITPGRAIEYNNHPALVRAVTKWLVLFHGDDRDYARESAAKKVAWDLFEVVDDIVENHYLEGGDDVTRHEREWWVVGPGLSGPSFDSPLQAKKALEVARFAYAAGLVAGSNAYQATQMLPSQMAERIKQLEDGLRKVLREIDYIVDDGTLHFKDVERNPSIAHARALLAPPINEAHSSLITNPD